MVRVYLLGCRGFFAVRLVYAVVGVCGGLFSPCFTVFALLGFWGYFVSEIAL